MKYVIGVDYGTQSGRAVLFDMQGNEKAEHILPYPDGVIDEVLPRTSIKLEHDWALQNPNDYILVLTESIPKLLAAAQVAPEDVIGLGIDFTACTILPIDENLVPLCNLPEYKDNPHAWVKLWKHHAAQDEANEINRIAHERGEAFIHNYGGKISSEWMLAKSWQVLNEAPEIYEKTDKFVEATDWVISQLTGEVRRNNCTAGYKSQWNKTTGYPSEAFFKALDPRLEKLTSTKLRGEIYPLGSKAGELQPGMAAKLGLSAGMTITVGTVDAHAAVPAVGAVKPGQMVMSMGTSICHLLIGGQEEKQAEGMCGVVADGIVPGYMGFEAGQSAVGDIFEWFVEHNVPAYAKEAADAAGQNIHVYLEKLASQYKPGESGLLALDWWNGNRSILVDTDLTGLMLGMTLLTKPEEMYRALLEATAYGTRMIIDSFEKHGVPVTELYACGGLPQKNKLLMQIYADVTNRTIGVSAAKQTSSLGAAMFAAVAAGKEAGGYDSIYEAAERMTRPCSTYFHPIPANVAVYEKLFQEYKLLHDYFGRGPNDVMKRLKLIKEQQGA